MNTSGQTKSKKCPKCDKVKPLLDYSVDRSRPNKRAVYCRTCAAEEQKRIRTENRRKIDAYNRTMAIIEAKRRGGVA